MRSRRGLSLLLLAMLAASCAGPTQLARQSERALKAGDPHKAYDLGKRGVDADPANLRARRAMTAAAAQRVDDWKGRIIEAAAIDSLAAADRALELRGFRGELARYRVEVPADLGFLERERGILDGAASIEYRRGEASLGARRPKEAYGHYRTAASFVASFADVQDKLRTAHQQGMTRVAILPFANDIDLPGISRSIADATYREVAGRLAREGFEFTELVSPDEIYASMTVHELDRLPPDAALRIYHKVSERDSAGKSHERWVETRFDAVARERVVSLRWELEVIDARSRATISTRSEPVETTARVAWTDFRADGNCADYRLMPPDLEDSESGKGVAARWRECFGAWTLPDMLERARRERGRSVYRAGYRDEFRTDSRKHPVLCGELPAEDDMAYLALEGVWRPVLVALKSVDRAD